MRYSSPGFLHKLDHYEKGDLDEKCFVLSATVLKFKSGFCLVLKIIFLNGVGNSAKKRNNLKFF